MARTSKSDSPIDRLYQLPLGEFVAARNALAKEGGADAAAIKALQKPSVPAWAVNQLYWRRRDVYDELNARAEDLRATHLATVRGKPADLRAASRDHEHAVEAALKATLALLAADGQPLTDATRQAIATTLRGLPGDEQPGRLTRPLQPRGFELLAGAGAGKVREAAAATQKPVVAPPAAKGSRRQDAVEKAAARERQAAAREALAAAARATRIAEQASRREEFEAARAVREAEKAQQRVEQAAAAVQEAEQALSEARSVAADAAKARDEAHRSAERARAELEEAREREEKARAVVD